MKIRGFLHLYIGEEAVAVGVMSSLRPATPCRHLSRARPRAGARRSARAIMAEMFGKLDGCSRGRGGSMHLFDAATRLSGATPSSAARCRWRSVSASRIR
jgi:pyruvate dehydrogenase E1 component alpha subunit